MTSVKAVVMNEMKNTMAPALLEESTQLFFESTVIMILLASEKLTRIEGLFESAAAESKAES